MRGVPRVVWVLAAGRFVNAVGSFLFLFLFLYLTGPRHLPLDRAGLLTGGLGAGLLLGNFTGGWFGDRYGHRRGLMACSAFTGTATLAIPWLPLGALVVVLPLLGYAGAAAGVSQGALVALAVPAGDRRRAVALSRAAFNAGTMVGPPLGALLSAYSFEALFVVDGIVTLIVRAATARLLPRDAPAATRTRGDGGLWRALRADRGLHLLLPAIVVVDVVYRQLYSTLPVYLRDHGHGVRLYAGLVALNAGLILCLELPATMALRRLPALGIIGVGYGLVGVGFGGFSLGAVTGFAVAAMTVVTVGEILYKTTATAHVLDAAPPGLLGQYQGLYTGAATSGTLLAPPAGAFVYLHAPPAALAAVRARGRGGRTARLVVPPRRPPRHPGTGPVGLDCGVSATKALLTSAEAGQGGRRAVDKGAQTVFEGLLAGRTAALAEGGEQGGRGTTVEQLGQHGKLLGRRDRVRLPLGLLLQDEPGDVAAERRDRAQREDRGEPAVDHGGQLLVECPERGRAQPRGGGDQASAVAVGEHGPPVGAGAAGQPVLPGLTVTRWAQSGGLDDRVGHPVEQFLLGADVPVQRRRLDAEVGGEPAHRQPVQPAGVIAALAGKVLR